MIISFGFVFWVISELNKLFAIYRCYPDINVSTFGGMEGYFFTIRRPTGKIVGRMGTHAPLKLVGNFYCWAGRFQILNGDFNYPKGRTFTDECELFQIWGEGIVWGFRNFRFGINLYLSRGASNSGDNPTSQVRIPTEANYRFPIFGPTLNIGVKFQALSKLHPGTTIDGYQL